MRASLKRAIWLTVALSLILSIAAIGPPQVGWVWFSADPLPAGTALFSFVNTEGVLIWEAGIPAVKSTTRGRIFVDQRGKTSTGVAIANVLPFDTILTLVLRDQLGVEIARVELPIEGNGQRALFVDQIFQDQIEDLPPSFIGSLTFETADEDDKVATVTVRGNSNARDEALFATLDVIDLDDPSDDQVAVLPQVGGAPGLSTQIVLVERSGQQVAGRIRLFDSGGAPLELESDGERNSQFAYDLPPNGVLLLELTRSEGTGVGYAVVSLEQGSVVPSAAAIFQFRAQAPSPATSGELGAVLTEAGILSRPPTTRARLFVDSFRTLTGVAVASHDNEETKATFRLIRDDGTFRETTRDLAAGGHLAIFADQLFPGLDRRDQTLEITSPNPLYFTTLKLSTNERSESVLTTLPVLDLNRPESGIRFFPQYAFGGGLATRLIFVSGDEIDLAEGASPSRSSAGDPSGGSSHPLSWLDPQGPKQPPPETTVGSVGVAIFGKFSNGSIRFRFSYEYRQDGELDSEVQDNANQEAAQNSSARSYLHLDGRTGWISLLDSDNVQVSSDGATQGSDCLCCLCPKKEKEEEESVAENEGEDPTESGFGVYLHSREAFYTHVDLEIPGRGFPWQLARQHRSRTQHDGILGHNWFLNYKRRLVIISEEITPLDDFGFPPAVPRFEKGDVVRVDGLGRVDVFKKHPDGSYRSPRYFYTKLIELDDGSFLERDPRGNRVDYEFPDGAGVARMVALGDRHGNTMRFEHDRLGRLALVLDTLGRPITYHYNADSRLIRVRDFAGRQVRFVYDQKGDLVESTSPAVTGTPNGNDFPDGKTTRYVYRDVDHPIFGHDLTQLYLPNDVAEGGDPRIEIRYADDYVFSVTIGGINSSGVPAGGMLRFSDRSLFGFNPFDPDLKIDLNEVVAETDVTDRNGNFTTYGFNKLKNIVSRKEFTNREVRPGDPESYETRFEYNQDGKMVEIIYPEGNSIEYLFDEINPDRFQQGNLLQITEKLDADRSGDQEEITTTLTYEPVYNQVSSTTEARGNDAGYVPQNGGVASPQRYRTTFTFDYQEGTNLDALAQELSLGSGETQALLEAAGVSLNLGDLNSDAVTDNIGGDTIQVVEPAVNLLPGSNMAAIEASNQQPIVSLNTYNRFGQITSSTDPEGNLTEYEHYPENDPDGDGRDKTIGMGTEPFGYLKQTIRDRLASPGRNSRTNPTPVMIRNRFFYDPVGNVVRRVDARGIRTEYAVNQLNQVVQITRASGHNFFGPDPLEPLQLTDFQYLERFFYDFNDNLVLHQVEDRGNTSSVDGNLPVLDLPPTVSDPDPTGGTAFVDTVYAYDILDNLLETVEEVGGGSEPLRARYRYDSNRNLALVIQPEGNALTTIYDERDLVFQDTRGATAPQVSALLSGNDPVDYDVRGGTPSTQTFHYDLNRNLIEAVDGSDTDSSAANNSDIAGAGDRTRYVYDGFDRLAGSVDSVGNQSVTQYDPAGNVVRLSRFGPVGGESPMADGPDALSGPVSVNGVVQAGNLVSDTLLGATEILYDELNRPFQTDQVLFVNSIDTVRSSDVADGAEDIGKGNLTRETANRFGGSAA